jgi:hypothetical protein
MKKKLSEMLNLELAWRRVKKEQYDDLLPDILKLRDVDYDIKATLHNLREHLDRGYQPSDALRIDVPKKSLTLRPGCSMIPEDRIVYQAVVDFISRRVEEAPPDACFSFRLKPSDSNQMFQFWRERWLEMRRKMREIYADGYCCLLKTDIAAYFEQIDLEIFIKNILNGKVKEGELIYLLRKLLTKWAVSEAKYIGIPQGCDASTYIGNVYLKDVDKIMVRKGFKYFRYSDEICVLTKDEWVARKAINALTHELRKLHLNLQDAKTNIIVDPRKVAEEIGTEDDDKTRTFDYEFERKPKRGKTEESKEEIIREYDKVTRNGRARAREVDVSKFRWCVNKLKDIKSAKAVSFILKRLSEFPFLADRFFEYLGVFANRESVKDGITAFLCSEDNIYEWQEMWLLFTLSKARGLSDKQLQVLRSIIVDKEKSWASRGAAIFTLGKLGDDTDRRWLRDLYGDSDNYYLKRAIIVSVHGLPKAARNSFYTEIESESYSVSRLVRYLKERQIETI